MDPWTQTVDEITLKRTNLLHHIMYDPNQVNSRHLRSQQSRLVAAQTRSSEQRELETELERQQALE